jgi:hypothetical protein
MATNFPQNLDTLLNPSGNDPLSNPSHSEQHINANDAIQALQTKVGVDGSTDTNSLDYRVNEVHTLVSSLEANNSVNLLGLESNNDLTINQIENPTTIDSLDSSIWRSANYELQLTRGQDVYSSLVKVVFLDSGPAITESNIVSTDGFENPANLDFGLSGSIMNLIVTPIAGSVSVRFIRTAIKK